LLKGDLQARMSKRPIRAIRTILLFRERIMFLLFSGAVENTNLDMVSQSAGFVNTIGVLTHPARSVIATIAFFLGHFEVFLPKDENYKQFDHKSEVDVPQIRTNTG